MVKAMAGCPAKMGFRMPAEWEPHEQCWMGWPVRLLIPPSLPPFTSLFCLFGCSATARPRRRQRRFHICASAL